MELDAKNYLPRTGVSRAKQLLPFIGIGQSTLWKWVKEGKFPAGKKLSPTITVWNNADVWEWLDKNGGIAQVYGNPVPKKSDKNFIKHDELYGFLNQSNIELASEKEIIETAVEFTQVCGIYFLIKNSKIVYIGQSTHCPRRIAQHFKDKDFDNFAILSCSPAELNILESLYILRYEPVLNGAYKNNKNPNAKYTPLTLSEIINKFSTDNSN